MARKLPREFLEQRERDRGKKNITMNVNVQVLNCIRPTNFQDLNAQNRPTTYKKMATGSRTSASFLTLCVHPRIALKCSSCHAHCGGMSVESGDNRTVTITANTGQLQSPSFLFQALIVGTCRCQAGRRLDDPARLVCESAWPEGGKSPATLWCEWRSSHKKEATTARAAAWARCSEGRRAASGDTKLRIWPQCDGRLHWTELWVVRSRTEWWLQRVYRGRRHRQEPGVGDAKRDDAQREPRKGLMDIYTRWGGVWSAQWTFFFFFFPLPCMERMPCTCSCCLLCNNVFFSAWG